MAMEYIKTVWTGPDGRHANEVWHDTQDNLAVVRVKTITHGEGAGGLFISGDLMKELQRDAENGLYADVFVEPEVQSHA